MKFKLPQSIYKKWMETAHGTYFKCEMCGMVVRRAGVLKLSSVEDEPCVACEIRNGE